MTRRTLALVAVAGCLACGPSAAEGDLGSQRDREQAPTLRAVVTEAAAAFMEAAPQRAGLSVAVVRDSDITSYHFGTAVLGSDAPPTDETLYPIASITKTVVGSMLAKAAVEGRVELTDDVRDYLDGAFPNLERDGQPVRLAHLVTHYSGLPHVFPDRPEMHHSHPSYGGDAVPWAAYVEATLSGYEREDFLRDLRTAQLVATPGTSYSYSNAAARVAGLVLERVYSQPLSELVAAEVTQPLGMSSTMFATDLPGSSQIAVGYDAAGREMPRDLTARGAAGGLVSTVVDLARYVRWHLDETDPVVELSHSSTAGYPPGAGPGLNWLVEDANSGHRRISSDGTVPGFNTRVVFFPELAIGVVVATNVLDGAVMGLTYQVANDILESLR